MTTEGNTRSAQEGSYHPAQKKSRLFLFLVAVVVVLVIIGIFTMLQHREQYNALAKETEKLAGELLTLEEMRIYYLAMESWSQITYDRLAGLPT